VRVRQTDRFHRPVAQGFAPAFCHHFDGQAAVEITCRFARFELGLVGRQQRVDERLVFGFRHRAVDIGGAFFLGLALVIARLPPGDGHVNRVGIDDGGDRVEKGQRILPGFGGDRVGQPARGQRAGGDDRRPVSGQRGHLAM